MEAAILKARVESSGVKAAKKDFDDLTASAGRAEGAVGGVGGAGKKAGDQVKKGAGNAAAAYRQLRESLDPVYRNSKLYEAAVRDVNAAVKSGVATQQQANRVLELAGQRYLRTTTETARASTASAAAARELGRANAAAGAQTANLTAQLNDIGVMLAAGQNPLQLALQQGTQINQVFGQMGGTKNALRGIAGAFTSMLSPMNLATLGIIAFGAAGVQALLSLIPKAKSVEDALQDTSASIDNYITLLEKSGRFASDTFTNLRSEILKTSQAHKDLIELAKIDAFKNMQDSLESISKLATNNEYLKNKSQEAGGLLNLPLEFILGDDLNKWRAAQQSVKEFRAELDDLQNATSIQEQYDAAIKLRDTFKENVGISGDMNDIQRKFIRSLSESIIQMQLLGAVGEKSAEAQARFNQQAEDAAKSQLIALNNKLFAQEMAKKYGRDTLEYVTAIAGAEYDANVARVKGLDISNQLRTQLIEQFAEQRDLAIETWNNEQAMTATAQAAEKLATALANAANFSKGLDASIATVDAEIKALESGANDTVARQIEMLRQKAKAQRDATIKEKHDIVLANAQYAIDLKQIEALETKLNRKAKITKELGNQSRAGGGAAKSIDQLQQSIERMNLAADPVRKYRVELEKLEAMMGKGLSKRAYDKAVASLNKQLAAQYPMVGKLSKAWSDWVIGGMRDFKGFTQGILKMFKQMIAEMIATAASNRILISLEHVHFNWFCILLR